MNQSYPSTKMLRGFFLISLRYTVRMPSILPPIAERTLIGIFFTFICAVVVFQAYAPERIPLVKNIDKPCKGTPIVVDYPYEGGFLDPHACKVQCDGDEPRYVQYSNNFGTQCETPPGCNDWGEDKGITCKLPSAS